LIVVEDTAVFSQVYDVRGIRIAGEFQNGRLSDGGERIVLAASNGDIIHDFVYDDAMPWPHEAGGFGPSLEVVDFGRDYGDGTNWTSSPVAGGSPGRDSNLPGDANRDGTFNSSDLVQVFQAGEYEDGTIGNSTWEEGDWNGDGDFDTGDLVLAFQTGRYSADARAAVGWGTVDTARAEQPGWGREVISLDDIKRRQKRPSLPIRLSAEDVDQLFVE
jgi:hypothetical protein